MSNKNENKFNYLFTEQHKKWGPRIFIALGLIMLLIGLLKSGSSTVGTWMLYTVPLNYKLESWQVISGGCLLILAGWWLRRSIKDTNAKDNIDTSRKARRRRRKE